MNTEYPLVAILFTISLLGIILAGPNIEIIGQPMQLNYTEGSWRGNMLGEGTVMNEYDVTINATITGILEGTPKFGIWNGKYLATYTWDSHKENDIGFLNGNYSWNIDDSGKVSGMIVSRVSGLLVGDMELQLDGTVGETGVIEGTWTGKFTPKYFSYGRVTPVPTTLRIQGSGEFEAKLEEKIITTSESTSEATPPTSSPIQTLQPSPSDETITHQGQILVIILRAVFIIAIVMIVILIVTKALKREH
ncbi:hypothetical protein [[Eubacterium] cellulosolvens]